MGRSFRRASRWRLPSIATALTFASAPVAAEAVGAAPLSGFEYLPNFHGSGRYVGGGRSSGADNPPAIAQASTKLVNLASNTRIR